MIVTGYLRVIVGGSWSLCDCCDVEAAVVSDRRVWLCLACVKICAPVQAERVEREVEGPRF